tara:strand:- start:411 stop:1025 length:615 start_codon:yes stop_codon:yes gene_type:complete
LFINENNLKLQHKLKSDRQVVKVGDDSSGLLLKDNRVFVEQQPSEEQEVATKKYVDDNSGGSTEFRQILHGGFNYSSLAGTKVYLPLNGTLSELSSTSSVNEFRSYVVPYDGYLNQVIIRSEEACGVTIVGFHKSSTGTEIPNNTATSTVTIQMTVDDTATKFSFGSSNTFSAGDIISISFDPSNDANDTNFTAELILDSSSGL